LTFTLCDIVGEVYGYSYPRLFIWLGVLSEIIFSFVLVIVSNSPAPDFFKQKEAYKIVFDPTIRYVFSGVIAMLVGEFMNAYLLTKWKIKLYGRLFAGRSIVSTALGQAYLTLIVYLLNYVGKLPWLDLIWMMLSGYVTKIIYAIAFVFPAWLIVRYLKRVENIDYYDINTNFTPFSLKLESNVST
jgi:uncharacterized integral membrane protein (TIGR00697 family)